MKLAAVLSAILVNGLICLAQNTAGNAAAPGEDYSRMYAFLQEGEFIQLSVEEHGWVTGFISRYDDAKSDQNTFLDQFFKEGKLAGNKLTFTTETVHGKWFEFQGTVERGRGKNPADEGYYVLSGTLIQHLTAQNKKTGSRSREVAFQSFPQDAEPGPQKRD
ncbi:MAG: hypothetical protein JOY93_12810 [Acidobacteriales bacterium]|nr:hypothetical protein [Terriglobales bacterium]